VVGEADGRHLELGVSTFALGQAHFSTDLTRDLLIVVDGTYEIETWRSTCLLGRPNLPSRIENVGLLC
jgi:hypothetical protein